MAWQKKLKDQLARLLWALSSKALQGLKLVQHGHVYASYQPKGVTTRGQSGWEEPSRVP